VEGPRRQTDVLVVFGGPHAYISPRWYDHVNVPTMNYVAVHATASPGLIEDGQEVYALLKSQIEQFEAKPEAYNIGTLPSTFLAGEMRGLVALEIAVDRWEGNFKLSQNRDEKTTATSWPNSAKRATPRHHRSHAAGVRSAGLQTLVPATQVRPDVLRGSLHF
jgi:predicted FMN-binding regulatory protein PaiB